MGQNKIAKKETNRLVLVATVVILSNASVSRNVIPNLPQIEAYSRGEAGSDTPNQIDLGKLHDFLPVVTGSPKKAACIGATRPMARKCDTGSHAVSVNTTTSSLRSTQKQQHAGSERTLHIDGRCVNAHNTEHTNRTTVHPFWPWARCRRAKNRFFLINGHFPIIVVFVLFISRWALATGVVVDSTPGRSRSRKTKAYI